jgi:hypothetical protein
MYHYHRPHHHNPLGTITNHYRRLDFFKPIEERLRPHVHKPLEGIKHVKSDHIVMSDIAPDFNNQKITYRENDSVLSPHVAANPSRTSHMHFHQKVNNEIIYATLITVGIVGSLFIINAR